MDPNAIPGLLKALEQPDPYVRIMAAEALGKIGRLEGITALEHTLQDADWRVRRRAVRALQRIGGAKVVPGLRCALDDPEPGVVWVAEMALRSLRISSAEAALAAWMTQP